MIFPESLKIASINMVTILMMSARMANPSLLKIKVFLNKDNVITSVREVTNKMLSRDSKFYKDLTRITAFLRGYLGSSSTIWIGRRYELEILHHCSKRVKTKSQRVFGANSYVCRSQVKEEKLVEGAFSSHSPLPSWIGLKANKILTKILLQRQSNRYNGASVITWCD